MSKAGDRYAASAVIPWIQSGETVADYNARVQAELDRQRDTLTQSKERLYTKEQIDLARSGLTASELTTLQTGGTVYHPVESGGVIGGDAKFWGVGMRFNTGKPPIWKGFINYFPRAMELVAFVSEFGANKYAWDNWQSITDWENNLRDSLSRHLVNQGKGRVYDKETKLLEAAHLAWNANAYLEMLAKSMETDDE